MGSTKTRIIFSFFLRIVVGSVLILFIFKKIPFFQILSRFKDSDLRFIASAFLLMLGIHFLGIKRWQLFIGSCGIRTSFWHLSFPFFSGLFFNLFFPSTLAGDLFRTVTLFGKNRSSPHIFASVVLDRFSGFLALSCVCIFSFLFNSRLLRNPQIVYITLGFSLAVGMSLFMMWRPYALSLFKKLLPQRFKDKVDRLKEAFIFFREHPKVFLKSFVYSIFIQVGAVVVVYLLLFAFHSKTDFFSLVGLVALANLISMLPLTIAGLGTRDVALIYFLRFVGIGKEVSFSCSLTVFFFYSLIGILGGLVYVIFYSRWVQYNKFLAST